VELRQLRAFVEIASQGHFGHAAQRLNLTQPALTQRIQALERELGEHLLERNARGVRLAPAGVLLLPHARQLVQVEDRALRDLKSFQAGITGRVQIAYQAAGDIATAAAVIAEYRRRFPEVEVETTAGSSGPNLRLIQDGGADVAFVLLPRERPPGVEARTIRREEVIAAMRTDHHLAQMDPVPIEALRGEPLGLPPPWANPHLIAALRPWLVSHTGAELNVVSQDPTELAIETVARSASALILQVRRYVGTPAEGMTFRSLSPSPLVELAIVYRSGDLSPTVANVLKVVEELAPFDPSTAPDGELI
jgi:DNA-binding transcriptional LysR family regulator